MQRNLYYQAMVRRQNLFRNFLFSFFLDLASYPRLLLEVFIRKNFGERYFRLSSAITITVILGFLPYLLKTISGVKAEILDGDDTNLFTQPVQASASGQYMTWYIFLGLFLLVSVIRYIETLRNPSVFNFARYSLYQGDTLPAFYKVKIPRIKTDARLVETVLEPLPFLVVGIVLWLLGQKLGVLLTACSLFYSLGYVAAYTAGDNFVMDKIDEIICNEELKKSFVDGLGEEETRGFRFMGRRPADPDMRRQILPLMTEKEDEVFVAN